MTVYDHIFDHLPARNTAYTLYIYMVLANRIYTPFMTVYDHIFDHFPAEILLIHRIYKVLANPIHGPRFVLRPCMPSEQLITAMLCRISAMLYCLTTAMLCRFSGSGPHFALRPCMPSEQLITAMLCRISAMLYCLTTAMLYCYALQVFWLWPTFCAQTMHAFKTADSCDALQVFWLLGLLRTYLEPL